MEVDAVLQRRQQFALGAAAWPRPSSINGPHRPSLPLFGFGLPLLVKANSSLICSMRFVTLGVGYCCPLLSQQAGHLLDQLLIVHYLVLAAHLLHDRLPFRLATLVVAAAAAPCRRTVDKSAAAAPLKSIFDRAEGCLVNLFCCKPKRLAIG